MSRCLQSQSCLSRARRCLQATTRTASSVTQPACDNSRPQGVLSLALGCRGGRQPFALSATWHVTRVARLAIYHSRRTSLAAHRDCTAARGTWHVQPAAAALDRPRRVADTSAAAALRLWLRSGTCLAGPNCHSVTHSEQGALPLPACCTRARDPHPPSSVPRPPSPSCPVHRARGCHVSTEDGRVTRF